MTLNYSKADNEAFASSWCPESTRPFTYEVRKSLYDYDRKKWSYEIFKAIEGAFAIQISYTYDMSEEEAYNALEYAMFNGDIEEFFIHMRHVFDYKKEAREKAAWARKLAEAEAKHKAWKAEFDRLGEISEEDAADAWDKARGIGKYFVAPELPKW